MWTELVGGPASHPKLLWSDPDCNNVELYFRPETRACFVLAGKPNDSFRMSRISNCFHFPVMTHKMFWYFNTVSSFCSAFKHPGISRQIFNSYVQQISKRAFNIIMSFNFKVLISPLLMYPTYKWGWKFLWLLPTYIIATEVWVFIAAYQNGYKAARLLMLVLDVRLQLQSFAKLILTICIVWLQAARCWNCVCCWILFSDPHSLRPLADWRHAGIHFVLDEKPESLCQQGEAEVDVWQNSWTLFSVHQHNALDIIARHDHSGAVWDAAASKHRKSRKSAC